MKIRIRGFTLLEKATDKFGGIPCEANGGRAKLVPPLRNTPVRGRSSLTGFTILEFLIAMVILYLTVSGIYYLYEVMSVYVKGGTALLSVNASGRNSVERMIRFIRQANMISIQDSGNRIEVRYDENNPPTKSTLDDTNIAFYYNNGDGKDSTLGDNRIYFDPDNAQNTANTILVSNVRKIGANSIFSLSDNYTVNINYKIEDPYSPDGYQAQDISIKVTRRN